MTTGAVLCGGASRRMGTDKALLEIDGVAMAERVAGALHAGGCGTVVFVGGDSAVLARFGRPTIADLWPGDGPLGGVLTALRWSSTDVLVAACDLPFLDASAVRAVLGAADVADDAVDVVVATTGRLEPMLAWWSHRASALLLDRWADGVRALHKAIATLGARTVAVDPAVMRNVNTVADLTGDVRDR